MNNVNYGGRYSKNLIQDITQQGTVPKVPSKPLGQTSYRPFEELAQNLNLRRPMPQKMHTYIDVKYRPSSTAVGVMRRPILSSGYTFVPPMSTLDSPTNPDGLNTVTTYLSDMKENAGPAVRLSASAAKTKSGVILVGAAALLSTYIVRPLAQIFDKIRALWFPSTYSAQNGITRFITFNRAAYLKGAAALLIVISGVAVFTQLVSDPKLRPKAQYTPGTLSTGNHTGNSSGQSSNATSNAGRKPGSTAVGAPSGGSGVVGAVGSAGSTSGGNSATGVTANGGGTVGRGGGTGSSPTYSSGGPPAPTTTFNVPTSSPAPATSVAPNPATAIPYDNYTVPSTSLQTGSKQVVGSSPLTLTTN